MKLKVVTESDITRLMSWFPTARSVNLWGGPKFRYPFTPESFDEDVHWREMDTWCLVGSSGELLAFGQFYVRHGRINLARLVVAPEHRGQGLGKQLVALLMDKGCETFPLTEFSLYVYKHNHAAKACYASMGFELHEYPASDELADTCIYMTRPIEKE
jgi:ribosomal protein S18 acetylase RimI-like enzyme